MQRLDIHMGVGIGPINFGMCPREVIAAIEEPLDGDNWFEGNLNGALLYPDLKFEFDNCDSHGPLATSRLIAIEARPRDDVRLFELALGDWTNEAICARLVDQGLFPDLYPSGLSVADPPMELGFDRFGRIDWFSMEDSPSLMSLLPTRLTQRTFSDEIIDARIFGKTRCGIVPTHGPILLSDLAREFGLAHDPAIYHEICFADAQWLIQLILHKDLAYGTEIMPVAEAKLLAQKFLAEFGSLRSLAEPGCGHFFTNATFHEVAAVEPRGHTWPPTTPATFDTGVLIITHYRSGCIWVEDED
jgi:hypothetical protein